MKGETTIFDQAQRSLWLEDQLWPKLREVFPELRRLPSEVLITVGYPSSGARGRSEKIKPCEVNSNWQGNVNEKAFLSVHPVYWDSARNVARALLFGAIKHTCGARWGATNAGLTKHDDGSITESSDCSAKLDKVMEDVGAPPAGFGIPFPVRVVQRARLRKYVPSVWTCIVSGQDDKKHVVIRAATDDGEFNCARCGVHYGLA